MREISRKNGFLPTATWLVGYHAEDGEPLEYCGTVQGIRDRNSVGAIQNLGIVPEHRRALGLWVVSADAGAGWISAGRYRSCLS